ncbi:MAG: phosphoenolpyruvate--protein phosphotransferase [Gammaproteobacteria bacterium]|jgi:phosphotransferase system, enzyme I, PtsP
MLETLHRIIQEVNNASDLVDALNIIVTRLKTHIGADVCSIYLTDGDKREHVLMATDGLRTEAVGKVALPLHRGLVGLVAERAEYINLDDASDHPSYMAISETGETRYHAFLGAPIVHNREVLGVLVIRQAVARKFDDEEVTFVLTLAAQLASAINHARASGELARLHSQGVVTQLFLKGNASSSGVAIGCGVVIYQPAALNNIPDRTATDVTAEKQRLKAAIDCVKEELRTFKCQMEGQLPAEDQALFDAWLMMLSEKALLDRALSLIEEEKNWAPGALRQTIEEHARVFDAMDDPYLRERAADIRDLGRRVLLHLQHKSPAPLDYPRQTVLVGDEVSAMELAEVPPERLVGVISAKGSSSSHVAILARALGVPAVMGVTDLPVTQLEGRDLIIDGYQGRIYISPQPAVVAEYQRLLNEEKALSRELLGLSGLPAETLDGHHVPLYLNTGLLADMSHFGVQEAEGIGLYRTEFPFMIRDRFPGEDSQYMNYRKVLEIFAPRPVVLRTLDIGGDKPLPYFPVIESNPFLGWRGVRISLDHPEIFLTQMRAMLRANSGLGNLHVMLPMVSTVAEVEELTDLIRRAHRELVSEGYAITMPKTGVMIEVPAAVYKSAAIAKRVDFISVGTNDLTQYLLAVDRNNPRVAAIYNDLHPALLQALQMIVQGARQYNCPVGVCGEMAGNPLATPLLLGLGIDSLSMSAGSLLRVKRTIRTLRKAQAEAWLRNALQMDNAADVTNYMRAVLEEAGLEMLIKPGKR